MRIGIPLRQRGKSTQRWEAWRQRSRRAVVARASSRGAVRCEVTGQTGLPLELHHLLGRDSEPWSSYPACLIAVTVDLHRELEREVQQELHRELRWNAIRHLAEDFNELAWFEMTLRVGATPLDAYRQLVQQLDDKYEYSPSLNAVIAR